MGEAKRRLAAALASPQFPGGRHRCPECFSTHVETRPVTAEVVLAFYGKEIAVCGNCRCAWEPVDESQIWDRTDRYCSTATPCDNCAFSPGSPEQADTEKWKALIESLRAGGQFFCHKGVPIEPHSQDGFRYKKGTFHHMRLCRGFLNALDKWWKAKGEATAGGAE